MRSPAEPRRSAPLLFVAFAVTALLAVAAPARAETTQSDFVLIRQEDVVAEDLYAAGNRIQIAGRIEGDLVASSFGELRIDGTVEGDVTAIAGTVIIAGVVEGSVRVVSPEVTVEGRIGEDLTIAGRNVSIAPGGSVGRDIVTVAWMLDLQGELGRKLEGFIRNATLGGTIDGDVEIDVRSLDVTDTGTIAGDLAFRSSRPATIAEGAEVGGATLDRTPLSPNVRVLGLGLLSRVLMVVFGAGLGLSMVWAATRRADRSARVLRTRPMAAVGQGLAVVALPFLLVGGVFAMTSVMSPEAALPLLLGTLPFLLAIFGMLVLAALVSPVPPAVFIGRRLRPQLSIYAQYLIGFLIIVGVSVVPYVGRVALAAVVIAGIGGWITDEREPIA